MVVAVVVGVVFAAVLRAASAAVIAAVPDTQQFSDSVFHTALFRLLSLRPSPLVAGPDALRIYVLL